MINRDERLQARQRFEYDVMPMLAAKGVVVQPYRDWKERWDWSFKDLGDGSWKRIIYDAWYGTVPMRCEINREDRDSYTFCVRLHVVGSSTAVDVWTISVHGSGGQSSIHDYGFRMDKLFR